MLKDTESHGLVFVQFSLNLFFSGGIQLFKETITELYENLSLETLIHTYEFFKKPFDENDFKC